MKNKQKIRHVISLIVLFAIILTAGCISSNSKESEITANAFASGVDNKITLYKSPTCGCCVGYAAELERNGFDVETIKIKDMSTIKTQYDIPLNVDSCHTAVFGDYFVEGHVPIEVVTQMLMDQPEIDGIALPDMPSGSTGMPGQKTGPWQIYSITNGIVEDYTIV